MYIHELVVRARQLASVAQLLRPLHWNHRFDSCQGTYSLLAHDVTTTHYTRENAQVVTNLQQICSNACVTTGCVRTACSQLVDNLLQGCWAQQTCSSLLTTYYKVVELNRLVPTTCQQDVFALLVPSLLTTYYKVVELNRLVPMLFQQLVNRMCSHCLFPACWQVVNGLLTTCYKVVQFNRLVTSCSNNLLSSCNSTTCQQVVSDKLVATW